MEAAMLMKGALVAAAAASGGGAGLCAWMACHRHAQRARLVRRARGTEDAQGAGAPKLAEGSLDERVIAYAQSLSHRLALKGAHSRVPRALSGVAAFEKGAATAGLQGTVSADGFAEARLRLALRLPGRWWALCSHSSSWRCWRWRGQCLDGRRFLGRCASGALGERSRWSGTCPR